MGRLNRKDEWEGWMEEWEGWMERLNGKNEWEG